MIQPFTSQETVEPFLRRAQSDAYSMEENLVLPIVAHQISRELDEAEMLFDYNELQSAVDLAGRGMRFAGLLHGALNDILCEIEGEDTNHIPLFSVRVFEEGRHGTTIHRNHPAVGPWAIGITLKGNAPFNIYNQDQLPDGGTIPLYGDGDDPVPAATLATGPGAAWTLYTKNELMPHSSGIVEDGQRRELLLFYGLG